MGIEDPRRIEVAAALIFRCGRLLIARRPPGVHLAGYWEFPGGKIESGESPEACLRREIQEELGSEIQVQELWHHVRHQEDYRVLDIRFFRCLWIRHEPRPIGCSELTWIRREQLGHYEFPPADMELIALLTRDHDCWNNFGAQ